MKIFRIIALRSTINCRAAEIRLQSYETNHLSAVKKEMLPRNQGTKDHQGNWHLNGLSVIIASNHPPGIAHTHTCTGTASSPQNQTLHHMRCQKRIKRWWNSFMCCLRHCAFDQIPHPISIHLLFLSCCFSFISSLAWGGNVPPWKWNRTNKWDWVCWPYFVILPPLPPFPWNMTCDVECRCCSPCTHTILSPSQFGVQKKRERERKSVCFVAGEVRKKFIIHDSGIKSMTWLISGYGESSEGRRWEQRNMGLSQYMITKKMDGPWMSAEGERRLIFCTSC